MKRKVNLMEDLFEFEKNRPKEAKEEMKQEEKDDYSGIFHN